MQPKPDPKTLTFGTTFSDHILEVDWRAGEGWNAPVISKYHKLAIDPAASVFHYALEVTPRARAEHDAVLSSARRLHRRNVFAASRWRQWRCGVALSCRGAVTAGVCRAPRQCFEGLKAYKDKHGNARLFRPDMNMKRMNKSMARLAMPVSALRRARVSRCAKHSNVRAVYPYAVRGLLPCVASCAADVRRGGDAGLHQAARRPRQQLDSRAYVACACHRPTLCARAADVVWWPPHTTARRTFAFYVECVRARVCVCIVEALPCAVLTRRVVRQCARARARAPYLSSCAAVIVVRARVCAVRCAAVEGYSLYIRPTGIATYAALGVATPKEVKVFTITCPVGPYYPSGFAPVALLAESKFARAWPGGSGDNKLGAYVLRRSQTHVTHTTHVTRAVCTGSLLLLPSLSPSPPNGAHTHCRSPAHCVALSVVCRVARVQQLRPDDPTSAAGRQAGLRAGVVAQRQLHHR